jgi:hypothetical protein
MFEPAVQGPKPSVPSKPRVKPSPPKRNDDTKVISNGDVKLPPKDNITPMRNIAEITNRNTDENSNVKNGSDIKLNSELVSSFECSNIFMRFENPSIGGFSTALPAGFGLISVGLDFSHGGLENIEQRHKTWHC